MQATLHTPDRHEALRGAPWNEATARATIQAIVSDIQAQHLPTGRWPLHPRDDAGDEPESGFQDFYLGSAGLWWALWHLQREGAATLRTDPAAHIGAALAAYRAQPDVQPSYFLGEAGILLVQWRLTGSRAAADALHAVVSANITHPSNEMLWGAPGTVFAAWHLAQATHEPRWRDLLLRHADHLFDTWLWDDTTGCHLWTQLLNGRSVRYFGAGHGFAGNVHALLKCADVLDAPRRDLLFARCEATLTALAVHADGAANWRPGAYTPRPGSPTFLMQWCHGAPGIVTSLAAFPRGRSAALDTLLLAAGEAVWRAGPLAKGHGLCHGTAGNGAAFLVLHQRSGHTLWLNRARAFAMHAIAQCEAMRAEHGQRRHALWTGDAGLALFLWQCVRGTAGLPGLDFI